MSNLSLYKWHSINLIPTIDVCHLYNDDATYYGSSITATWFGIIVHMQLPFKLPTFSLGYNGLLYSRKRKIWYRSL